MNSNKDLAEKKDTKKCKLVKKSSKAQQNTIDGWEEH